ncbi:TIGR02234 family membrane protein [Nocardia aurantiaca]|uniref:TIGR02234 family membrane protein n=1 Tax=Nocardia aurantiaca TaxID=2675850 RepID=A0A6I3KZE8_9NOCA|nr:TIGR02234 family membrane protein [Nocardia aurantiaca]MTE13910.1 TIGR02234 family membrane protein [Nocardia aurantiaca]
MSGPDPDATEGAGAHPDSRPAGENTAKSDAAVPGWEPSADSAASIADRAKAADLAETESKAADAEADARAAAVAASRRRPLGAVALLVVAAGLMWVSSRMTWVTLAVTREDVGVGRTIHLSGSTWFGALTPLALALLATIAAVFATRGWPRRLVGVVVAVLAAVAAVPAFWLLMHRGNTAERAARLAELRVFEHGGAVQVATLPEWLALLGAIAAFGAGLLLVRMPAESARMSGKYENPAVRKSEAARVAERHVRERGAESGSQAKSEEQLSGRVLWDALDEGVDPTDDETDHPAAHDDPGTGDARGNHH